MIKITPINLSNIELLNIRMGWATNSSSTHSIVFFKENVDKNSFAKKYLGHNFSKLISNPENYFKIYSNIKNCEREAFSRIYLIDFYDADLLITGDFLKFFVNIALFNSLSKNIKEYFFKQPVKKWISNKNNVNELITLLEKLNNENFTNSISIETIKKKYKQTKFLIEDTAKFFALYLIKDIFSFNILEESLNFSEKFKQQNEKIPINFLNTDIVFHSEENWSLFDPLNIFDIEKFLDSKTVTLKNKNEAVLFYNEFINKISSSEAYIVTNFDEKISENLSANEKYEDVVKKFFSNNTESLNNLLKKNFFYFVDDLFSTNCDDHTINTNFKLKKEGNVYTIFNANDGVKLKFSLKNNSLDTLPFFVSNFLFNYTNSHLLDKTFLIENNIQNVKEINSDFFEKKALTPELVDLKISDYCPFGCLFCYQSSTKKGVHADFDKLKEIINMLAKINLFEIALGGGEPTLYPQFIDLIKFIDSKNISVNFTTYNYKLFNNKELLKLFINNTIKAIGFSVHKSEQIDELAKIKNSVVEYSLDPKNWSKKNIEKNKRLIHFIKFKMVAQVVVGAIPPKELLKIIEKAKEKDIHILFLGFKNKGFGEKYTNIYDNLVKSLSIINLMYNQQEQIDYGYNLFYKANVQCFSIDTKFVELASLYNKAFNLKNIPSFLYTSEEGKFSMYIDAVKNKMGKSSYCEEEEMIPLTTDVKEFVEAWLKF